MKAEHKTKWIEALRSGNYTQGHGFLKYTSINGIVKYCCLGVLCEVLKDELGLIESESLDGSWSFNGSRMFPPHVDALTLPTDATQKLVYLNDNRGQSFPAIADWIETNVPTDTETEAETKAIHPTD